ncbi:MAG: aminoglycoside phosphotransferase family protein, partial [Anaerolineae bacterium]
MFATALTGDLVRVLLVDPGVCALLHRQIGDVLTVEAQEDRPRVFAVHGSGGDFILRFPADEQGLAALRKEQAVQRGLRPRVTLPIPDTEVIEPAAESGLPCFAIHTHIPGEPLGTSGYRSMSAACRDRLIDDLATFLSQTHAVPIAESCRWLGLECTEDADLAGLTALYGKPTWFSRDTAAAMRPVLAPHLPATVLSMLADTADRFHALPRLPELLVFGHGDLHGFNMGIVEDATGPRLAGVFDLGNAGVLDIHEDLFRLNLIDEDLLRRTVARYQEMTGARRHLDPARIEVYYRAFLFYLMDEWVRDCRWGRVAHMRGMFERHLAD